MLAVIDSLQPEFVQEASLYPAVRALPRSAALSAAHEVAGQPRLRMHNYQAQAVNWM